ncbi:MAG: AAA family ATPase [Bacilli bacterium]|nr:AAA family ATPase [Bacilli bacterium]
MSVKKAKVITITSVKGGTGKSTFTLSLAGELSKKNKKTVILDLDLSAGVIAPSLNIKSTNDIYTLTDDMANGRYNSLDKYINKYNDNIDIIASTNDPRNTLKIYPGYIENIIKQLEYKYDVILIDTNHVTSNINLAVLDISTSVLYIITDDLMDLKNMKTMISIYEDMNVDKYKIILNNSIRKSIGTYEVKTVLEKDIDYTIPNSFYEKNIQKYVYNGKILTLEKEDKTFNQIADDILK